MLTKSGCKLFFKKYDTWQQFDVCQSPAAAASQQRGCLAGAAQCTQPTNTDFRTFVSWMQHNPTMLCIYPISSLGGKK